jgi:hypothetical protein
MMRLVTFVAGTAFIAAIGAAMFLVAGAANLPSVWISHVMIVSLDLGRFHWSARFPLWLHAVGVVIMLASMSLVVWALRHNEYLSARIRTPSARGSAGSAWRRPARMRSSGTPTMPAGSCWG